MDRITICDATLTVGSGALGAALTASEKLRIAHELTALGVDVIEVGCVPNDRDLIRRMSLELTAVTVAAVAQATRQEVAWAAQALEGADRELRSIRKLLQGEPVPLLGLRRAARGRFGLMGRHQFQEDVPVQSPCAPWSCCCGAGSVVAAPGRSPPSAAAPCMF